MSNYKHPRTLKEIAEANKRWSAEQFETQAQRLELDGAIQPENPPKIKKLRKEIQTLRQQLAESQGRVAELEDALVWALGKLAIEVPTVGGSVSYMRAFEKAEAALGKSSSKAFILHKQAEAVEYMMLDLPDGHPFKVRAKNEAQRLRQTADDAERAGGGQ